LSLPLETTDKGLLKVSMIELRIKNLSSIKSSVSEEREILDLGVSKLNEFKKQLIHMFNLVVNPETIKVNQQ